MILDDGKTSPAHGLLEYYCNNNHPTKSNVQSQYKPSLPPCFPERAKTTLKVIWKHTEPGWPKQSQAKGVMLETLPYSSPLMLQSHRDEYSMALAQSTVRDECTGTDEAGVSPLQPLGTWQAPKVHMEERGCSKMVLGKLDVHMPRNEVRPPSLIPNFLTTAQCCLPKAEAILPGG